MSYRISFLFLIVQIIAMNFVVSAICRWFKSRRQKHLRQRSRIIVLICALMIIPYIDSIAIHSTMLLAKRFWATKEIHKKVSAEGFLLSGDSEFVLKIFSRKKYFKAGFNYIEIYFEGNLYKFNKFDGGFREPIMTPSSRYRADIDYKDLEFIKFISITVIDTKDNIKIAVLRDAVTDCPFQLFTVFSNSMTAMLKDQWIYGADIILESITPRQQ